MEPQLTSTDEMTEVSEIEVTCSQSSYFSLSTDEKFLKTLRDFPQLPIITS